MMTNDSFTKVPWDGSTDDDAKKEERIDVDAASASDSAPLMVALSYSSTSASEAPTRDDESSVEPVTEIKNGVEESSTKPNENIFEAAALEKKNDQDTVPDSAAETKDDAEPVFDDDAAVSSQKSTSSSSISDTVTSSSNQVDESRISAKVPGVESPASGTESNEVADIDSNRKDSEEALRVASARPPLFPRRARSGSTLRKDSKPGVASFFRSRSNPGKTNTAAQNVDHTDCCQARKPQTQHDTTSSDASVASISVASVPSCSDDSVELVPEESVLSIGTEQAHVRDDMSATGGGAQTVMDSVAAVMSDGHDTAIGVVKDASADADMLAGVGSGISASTNEIQDPWPNPWSDNTNSDTKQTEPDMAADPLVACASTTSTELTGGEVPLCNDRAPPEDISDETEEAPRVDSTDCASPEPSLNNWVSGSGETTPPSVTADPSQASNVDGVVSPQVSSEVQEATSSVQDDDSSWKEEITEDPALLDDQKALATAEDVDCLEEENKNDGKGRTIENKGRRQSSLWKRTKSLVKSRRHSHSSRKQADRNNNDNEGTKTTKEAKKSKGKRFKVGYLWFFKPCNKLATIDEIEEGKENRMNEHMASNTASEQDFANRSEATPEDVVLEDQDDRDDLIEVHDNTEDHDLASNQQITEVPVAESNGERYSILELHSNGVSEGRNDDEAKSDFVKVDSVDSKQNTRSWLTDLPSIESMMGQEEPIKSYSVSSLGEVSKISDVPQPNMINSINFYVNAATKAVQRSLYEAPLREFEKMRELTCGVKPAAEQSSLIDTESRDSILCKKDEDEIRTTKSMNPFSAAFSELVDVLECGTGRVPSQPPTKKFEEEKIEMFGSISRGEAKGGDDVVF